MPFNLPVLYDGLGYFWYGIDMSIVSQFPLGHDITNNLWPSILGIMFSSINSENFLDYSNAQRILSSIISVMTIIPIFFLCNRFFDKKLADSSLENYGVTYELETEITLDDIHIIPQIPKLYVVMRIPQNKYVMTHPIDLYKDIAKAKAKYLDYDYKKKNYRINTVQVIL